jgi:hypothetical protein
MEKSNAPECVSERPKSCISESTLEKLKSMVPQCMLLERPKLSNAPPLTDEQTKEATTQLVNESFLKLEFPRVVRLRVDPDLSQQKLCVFSFVPSRGATPDKDGAFGVVKFRGAFSNVQEAEERCTYLIQNVDSYNENFITFVGKEFPLTRDPKYVEKTKEIDIRMKMDTVAKDDIKQRREAEKKEMDEMQERQKQLLADTTEQKQISFDDLDYYTTLRTKKASLRMFQEECGKKLVDAQKSIKQTVEEIEKLDVSHPDYKAQYEEKYRKACEACNFNPDDKNSPTHKMIELMK